MLSFVSVIDLFGNILLEEQMVEEDRKYEGCCLLSPHGMGELWPPIAPPTASAGLEIRAREGGYVKDPWKDVVRSPSLALLLTLWWPVA